MYQPWQPAPLILTIWRTILCALRIRVFWVWIWVRMKLKWERIRWFGPTDISLLFSWLRNRVQKRRRTMLFQKRHILHFSVVISERKLLCGCPIIDRIKRLACPSHPSVRQSVRSARTSESKIYTRHKKQNWCWLFPGQKEKA